MKQENSVARMSASAFAVCLVVAACFASARAQTVIPSVCFESKPETLTRTLAAPLTTGNNVFSPEVTQEVPRGFYKFVFNPGGATEESFPIGYIIVFGRTLKLAAGSNLSPPPFLFAHAAGETVLLTSDGQAVFGYNNLSSTAVTLPRGIPSNYFFDGNLVYPPQPSVFQPGIHANIFPINVVSGYTLTWLLNGGQVISTASAAQGCATITYQGRLTDSGLAASGQYDLQFQAFDTLTDGISQSELITLQNVQVTGGVFTVPLFFGSTFINNFKPRFLAIGVRPGIAPDTDPFTLLTPRQPLTQVPFAVNAQTAQTAFDVRLQLTVNAPPPSAECNETSEYGQIKFDATNNRLYICAATGWKAFLPQ